jgi:hypothetical protein
MPELLNGSNIILPQITNFFSYKIPEKNHEQKNNNIQADSSMFLLSTAAIDNRTTVLNLNSVNQLIFVMVKCGVLFEVDS